MPQRLYDRLDKMIGRVFMYNTKTYRILSYKIENGVVTIATNKEWINFSERSGLRRLEEFLPAPDEEKQELALRMLPQNGELTNLKEILIENIKRVQDDEKFVGQANAINKSVNAVINLAKLELSFYKAKQKEDL